MQMRLKLCQNCGYQLHHKSQTCPWCATPVKNHRKFGYFAPGFLILAFIVGKPSWENIHLREFIPDFELSATNDTQSPVEIKSAAPAKNNPPAPAALEPEPVKLFVQENVINLYKYPSLDSPAILKLKKGQSLTQGTRSENWINVSADDHENTKGWVHTSLVGKKKPVRLKRLSHEKTFIIFQKSFERFNAEIKEAKGMTFFNGVEYFGNGVIHVTATDILLSAPENYKRKYLLNILKIWSELAGPTSPITVRMVDARGHVRLEEKQS